MLRPLFILLTLSIFSFCCFGQKESLLIGPGDSINIQVFDTPEMDQTVRVTDSGVAPLEFIGDVKVAGETPGTAARLIEQALIQKQVMVHPQVKVSVDEFGTQKVAVLGQVTNPGSYPFTTPQPITRIISEAGGLTGLADHNITIQRHGLGQEKVKYYLANDADLALDKSVLVYPGDTVVVPRAPVVYVMGDVSRPGGYPIVTNDSQMTVMQAMAMAGSANKTAQKHIRLIRKTPEGPKEVPIQLAAIEKGKQTDMQLQPDDILYIPFSWGKNIAIGAAGIAASTGGAAIYAVH